MAGVPEPAMTSADMIATAISAVSAVSGVVTGVSVIVGRRRGPLMGEII